MVWNKRIFFLFASFVTLLGVFVSCKISYKFNGSSIDYSVVKTINIEEFPNRAPLVYASLSSDFTEKLKDELQMSVSVRFVNKVNSTESFERTFSSYQTFSNEYTIDQVQGELNEQLIEDIVSQIFNATVANW